MTKPSKPSISIGSKFKMGKNVYTIEKFNGDRTVTIVGKDGRRDITLERLQRIFS